MEAIHRAARLRRAGGIVIASAVAAGGLLVGVMATPADAHETREVGDMTFVVGWGDEPTFTGFKNRVQVRLSDPDEEPIDEEGNDVELTAGVSIEGEEPVELPMEEQFGEPGDYGADIIPTRPGTYTFQVTGTVNGEDVDESFTSGEETFSEPRLPAEIHYPIADPAPSELSERLDRELARVADEGDSSDSTGTILGIIGIVVAVVAVGGAGVALRRSSRAGA